MRPLHPLYHAIQYDGTNSTAIVALDAGLSVTEEEDGVLVMDQDHGRLEMRVGDWMVVGHGRLRIYPDAELAEHWRDAE